MGIVWTILVGFVIGVIAKFLHPGKDNMGFIATILLGILIFSRSSAIGDLRNICGKFRLFEGAFQYIAVRFCNLTPRFQTHFYASCNKR